MASLVASLDDVPALRTAIDTLVDEPGALARDGGMIRDGVDPSSTTCGTSADRASR